MPTLLIDANYFVSHKLVFWIMRFLWINQFLFRANDENKNGNSKNINETALKERLSIVLSSNLVLKHENIRLLID